MTAFFGADVDQLRELAAQFQRTAERVDSVLNEVNNQATVATRWEGPDSESFRSEWQGHGSAAMRSAGDVLRDAARQLQANARAQEQASTDDGAIGAGSGLQGWPGGWSRTLEHTWNDGNRPPWMRGLPGFQLSPGLWPDPVRIHDWTHGLHDIWDTETPVFGMKIGDFVGHVPGGGDIGKIIAISDIAFDPSRSILDKAGALGDMVTDKFAGDLMGNPLNPTAYLSGLAILTWKDVIDEGAKADFSSTGMQTVANYAWTHPSETVDIFAHATVDTFAKLTDHVGFGFVGDMLHDAGANADFSPAQVADTATYALGHPDVVVQEVGKAIGEVGAGIGQAIGKAGVNAAIDFIKFW